MFVYTVRKFNLFIITLLILTMVGYSLARFDPHSPWTLIGFWQGWSSYLVQLMEFNFGLNKMGCRLSMSYWWYFRPPLGYLPSRLSSLCS